MTSLTLPVAGIALIAFAGLAAADGPRAQPRGGNALAADMSALGAGPDGHVADGHSADGPAAMDRPAGRRGGHALGSDMAAFGRCGSADATAGCPLQATVAEN